jgi:hypothetical protein
VSRVKEAIGQPHAHLDAGREPAIDQPDIACECMLCDLPFGQRHEPVTWRLVWDFNRPPAVEHGEGAMLMCDHCFHDWVDNPDEFGGDPVRFHRI